MDTRSVPKTRDSRETRGVQLARERFPEIERTARHTWTVPSCTEASVRYVVRLRPVESCSCDDNIHRREPCKHVYAVGFIKAKSGVCSGCGERHWNRDMVELFDGDDPLGNHDNLTYFDGDRLCPSCTDGNGVSR